MNRGILLCCIEKYYEMLQLSKAGKEAELQMREKMTILNNKIILNKSAFIFKKKRKPFSTSYIHMLFLCSPLSVFP